MNKSESIKELATALAKAQGSITGALKDSKNPFFKSQYADLASCWDAAREHLSSNGLAVIQTTSAGIDGVTVTTMLCHSSGEWVQDSLTLTPKDESPQAVGSCITYGRRYSLAAIVGIAQVDDDGNAASGKDNRDDSGRPEGWRTQDTKLVTEHVTRILDAIKGDRMPVAVDIWNEIKGDHAFATAVWASLPSPVKKSIKDNLTESV